VDISVIVTTFNEERHVSRCIGSLLTQDVDLEVLVVDDGSSDRTCKVVECFVSKNPARVRLIRLGQNYGPGNARNVGAHFARGRVIVFLDADMEFPPNFIRMLTQPILDGEAVATCPSTEIVANVENPWVKVQGQTVRGVGQTTRTGFIRAILRDYFLNHGGYDASKGYFDDLTFHERTGVEALVVDIFLRHYNPDTAKEVFRRNRWIGRSVTKAHKKLDAAVMVLKRFIDFSPIYGLMFLSSPNLLLRIIGVLFFLIFLYIISRHRVLPSPSKLEKIKIRLFYVPAYRLIRAAGFLLGFFQSLFGIGWRKIPEKEMTRISKIQS